MNSIRGDIPLNIIKRIIFMPLELIKFMYWETTIEILYYLLTGKNKSYDEIKSKR